MTRAEAIADFLAESGWGDAARHALAGDASRRRYERLVRGDKARAVLMDAPPETGEDVRPFLAVAQHLAGLGLSPPEIMAADTQTGLLLLEDLGDALFARVIADDPERERPLYAAAIEVLAHVQSHPPPASAPLYGPDQMAEGTRLAAEWYAPGLTGRAPESIDARADADTLQAAVLAVLREYASETRVLMLRDFHAENLLWLPERQGLARVGLLDFQDAAVSHPAFDVISLLEDARRDVTPEVRREMTAYFAECTGGDAEQLASASAVLGAQRAIRILGIFARLALRDGKAGYAALMPRVWAHLARDLAHPACAGMRGAVRDVLPEPTAERLAGLTARATAPAI